MKFPLTFEISTRGKLRAFVGVLQFSAPEGQIHLPLWVTLLLVLLLSSIKVNAELAVGIR
jgi:hypothetical protein